MNGLVLVGASGLALEATCIAVLSAHPGPVSVVDDDPARWGSLHGRTPVLGPVDVAVDMDGYCLVLTLGQGTVRRRVAERLSGLGLDPLRYTTLLHPRIVLPGSCSVGTGCVAMDGVVLTSHVKVGDHVVLMPQVTLTHGCVVEDFATLCAGVTLGGDVHVGSGAYLGMNSSVRQGVRIGEDSTLGMGSVLLHDLPPGETWVGVPARPLTVGAMT